MVVFNLYSDQIPDVTIDIFPAEPFDFATEYARAKTYLIGSALEIPVICLAGLSP